MSNSQAVLDAILTKVTSLTSAFPIVWPNEKFDPQAPAGRFAAFAAGTDFAVVDVQFFSVDRTTHGSSGLRSRVGEVIAAAHGPGGEGPGRAFEIAEVIAAGLRDVALLSGEVQFNEPVVTAVGEDDDGRYIALVRCPFTTWSTSP